MEPQKIPVKKDSVIGIADLLIMGAYMMHEMVDMGADAEVTVKTTLKNGKRYESKLTVVAVDEDEELTDE